MFRDFREEELTICAWLMIALGCFSLIAAFFLTTPYGRYSRGVWGFGVDTKLAWMLQESPSFFVPFVMFMVSHGPSRLFLLKSSPNDVLVLLFLIHYFRR